MEARDMEIKQDLIRINFSSKREDLDRVVNLEWRLEERDLGGIICGIDIFGMVCAISLITIEYKP